MGEVYVDGWWECERLGAFFEHVCLSELYNQFKPPLPLFLDLLCSKYFKVYSQTIHHAKEMVRQHDNLGNDLFEAMLCLAMTYSCGYWAKAKTLAPAQDDKHDLICKKLQ